MYLQLLIAVIAAVTLIILARRYPFVAAALYLLALIYLVACSKGRTNLGTVNFRFPLPFYRAIKAHHYGRVTNRSVLNMILFIPYGYLLPPLRTAYHTHGSVGATKKTQGHTENTKQMYTSWWIAVSAGFFTSLVIETSQYCFKLGVFELDDLVKNTMGTAVGWLIWKSIGLKPCKQSVNEESSNADNGSAFHTLLPERESERREE